MTGPVTVTREHLLDCAAAASDDPGVPSPRLKLTQKDDTHGTPITEPSFGTVTNIRFDESDQTLYGDFEGIPAWLAEILPVAYPNRSVEIYWGVQTTTGGQWKAIIGAVQLLGVEWPGCMTLEDLPMYYGKTKPETVEVTLAARGGGGVMKLPTKAAVNVDEVRRSYYDKLDDEGNWSFWIKGVLLEPNQLVVEDEWEGQLFLVNFSIDGDVVSFEEPVPVKVEYVPMPEKKEEKAAAVAAFAAGLMSTRTVAVSYATPKDSGRVTKASTTEGGTMSDEDRKALAVKMGLPEDATEEQVNEKLQEQGLAEAGDGGEGGEGDDGGEGGDVEPAPADTGLTVTMDRAQAEALQRDALMGREARLSQIRAEAAKLVDDAVEDGRIAPASHAGWLKAIFNEQRGELVKSEVETLAKLSKGRIPLEERGVAGSGDETEQFATGEAYPKNWFPEVETRRARFAAEQARGARVFTEV